MSVSFAFYLDVDHNGATNKCMMLAGYNDTDAKSATTYLVTPGFKGSEHPRECLNFWYNIGVSFDNYRIPKIVTNYYIKLAT